MSVTTPEHRLIHVNGIDLHVTSAGVGEPVLLLHGLTANAGFETLEIAELAQQHLVVAPDLRGHGRSTRPAAYTLQDHVSDMLALLDALEIERTAVMGTSMGSYVAQALALAAPERVSRLILVVARAHGTTTATARYLSDHADEVKDMTTAEQQLWIAQRMFAPSTPHQVLEDAFIWSIAEAEAGQNLTPEQFQAANDALANFDFRPQLPTLDIPTLVVSGRHDILNPPEDGAELARLLPDARLEVFEDSGHMLPREEPERLGELARTFLGSRQRGMGS